MYILYIYKRRKRKCRQDITQKEKKKKEVFLEEEEKKNVFASLNVWTLKRAPIWLIFGREFRDSVVLIFNGGDSVSTVGLREIRVLA
ncbi:unnamed protein product [Arabidopsis halleri]